MLVQALNGHTILNAPLRPWCRRTFAQPLLQFYHLRKKEWTLALGFYFDFATDVRRKWHPVWAGCAPCLSLANIYLRLRGTIWPTISRPKSSYFWRRRRSTRRHAKQRRNVAISLTSVFTLPFVFAIYIPLHFLILLYPSLLGHFLEFIPENPPREYFYFGHDAYFPVNFALYCCHSALSKDLPFLLWWHTCILCPSPILSQSLVVLVFCSFESCDFPFFLLPASF